jgi:regulator of protease activity HflC (stomatin/prohibitin superfamily)
MVEGPVGVLNVLEFRRSGLSEGGRLGRVFMFDFMKVMEYQRGVLFRDGRFVRLLEPGLHLVRGEVVLVDLRRQLRSVDAVVRTRDGVPVGVELMVAFRVADPRAAVVRAEDYAWLLANDARASVYRAVSMLRVTELAGAHNRLELEVQDRLALEAESYGIRVEDVSVRQVRYPRALRRKLKRMEVPGLA